MELEATFPISTWLSNLSTHLRLKMLQEIQQLKFVKTEPNQSARANQKRHVQI
jgi:hypothetical protein